METTGADREIIAQALAVRMRHDFGSIDADMYGKHNQRVRETVPPGQLLEYNVKQGWGPLCEFLEVPIPDTPYPRLNEGGSIRAIYVGMQLYGAVTWGFYFALAGAAAYLATKPGVMGSWIAWVLRRQG
jgi:hypothetical protein